MLEGWLGRGPKDEDASAIAEPVPLRMPHAFATARLADVLGARDDLHLGVEDAARRAYHLMLAARLLGASLDPARKTELGRRIVRLLANSGALPWRDPQSLAETLTLRTATGLGWPTLPGARQVWTHGLTWLKRHAAGRVRPDGTAPDRDPAALLAWLEVTIFLAADARREGVQLPDVLQGAMAAASWHLYLRGAPHGTLPPGRRTSVVISPSTLLSTARNALIALGWARGPIVASTDDHRLATWFAGVRPPGDTRALVDSDWSMWSFGGGRVAVLHALFKSRPARIVVDAGVDNLDEEAPGPELEVDGIPVLNRGTCSISGLPSLRGLSMPMARVDVSTGRASRKGSVFIEGKGDKARWRREIVVRQARVVVEDSLVGQTGPITVRWRLAPGWSARATEAAFTAEHSQSRPLKVDLDERLSWQIEPSPEGAAFVGTGLLEPAEDAPLRFAIEWT
jgi:hypothetical protein